MNPNTDITREDVHGWTGPYDIRLLSGWLSTGRPDTLEQHLRRYGQSPLPRAGRSGRPGTRLVRAVEEAGLTGRGGAAFPTGRKMRSVAEAPGPAVVVANGMESEFASRKDEMLLDVAPHLVLDGAALAAASVGGDAVHLVVPRTRHEQARRLTAAVAQRRERRLDQVPIEVHELPHHYVSSEETSVVNWLNGGGARPTATPPRPYQRGVNRRPTLVDNVETLAHLALIARYGARWFRTAGTSSAPGTTLVTLSGAVAAPGVYEIPMGTPIGDVLGMAGGATGRLSAILAGGFFGSWLPVGEAVRIPFAKDDLATVGAGPGAGVLVALPDHACGLAETAHVLGYLADQSAGQCGPCRFGLRAVADDFAEVAWRRPDFTLLSRLRDRVGLLPGRGACRHPDGASRLAATALETFADDVRRHVHAGPCAAAGLRRLVPVPAAPGPGTEGWR